jgi:apolipoprotein N-acyltransferase
VRKILDTIEAHSRWAALLAGGISATGFAPLGLWPLTLISFALLIHLVAKAPTKKRAFQIGYGFGIGHFCVGMNWIAGAFRYQEAMPVWLGWIAVVALSLYIAVYPALAALGAWTLGDKVRSVSGKSTIPFVTAFAGSWIITEWLRSWVFTGFAWNPLSAVQMGEIGGWALPTIGTFGVSGLVILLSAILWGLLAALLSATGKAITARFIDLALLLLACWILSLIGGGNKLDNVKMASVVTIVQPNIGQQDKYEPGYDALNFAKLASLSRPLKDQGPRLLLWPEAAIPDYLEDGYPYRYYQFQAGESAAGARAQLTTLMGSGDVLLTGSNRLVIDKDGQLAAARNSMSAMDANGRLLGHYDKSHLVPYGEYLALRWLLEPLGATRLVPGDLDFIPGPGPQTLTLPGFGKVGIQICYEIIFSGQVIDRNNRPAFLFNPSNDAWFGSWGPPQHLAQARLRAVEEGLPVIRSTPTGISAIIDSDGGIVDAIPLGKAGRIDAKLPAAKSPTLFARYGNILPLGFASLLLAFSLFPVVIARRSR